MKDSETLQFQSEHERRNLHLWAPSFSKFGGGITAFSRELAMALQIHDSTLRLYGKMDRSGDWEGMPLWGADRFFARLRTPSFAAGLLAACVRSRPAGIISTHLNFGPFARLAKRYGKIPYTLVAHGIDVHSELSPARLAALRSADRIIAVSEWTSQRVLALGGIPSRQLTVLANTYDDSRFVVACRSHALTARYQIQADEKVILTVARLDSGEGYKGYDRVLKALPEIIRTCGKVRFLIAGKGGDRARLERMARELGVSNQVSFAGFVPDEELADHYRLADVFAMPSTGEGFGIVFLESLGCGTPVLGGNQDGSVDALDQGRLGKLVDPTSVEEIGKGLIELLRGHGPKMWLERQALSEAVREKYGRDAFRKRVREIFGGSP